MKHLNIFILSTWVLWVLVFSSGPVRAETGGLLTLARAKQISLENSPTLAAARERVVQAMESIVQARADYLPTLSLISAYDYTERTAASSANAAENQYTGRISATQVLFNGFYRKYNTLSARYGEKMNRAAQDDARRILIWSVAQSYLNAQQALEDIRIAEADMIFNRDQEKDALAKERLGTGSYSDVLNFKTKVNSAEAEVIEAGQAYREACYGLAALMGYKDSRLPGGMEIQVLADSNYRLAGDTGLSDAGILSAMDARPDLKQDELAVRQARAGVEREKSGYYPSVSLTGAYGTGNVDELGGMDDSDNMGASLGVEIRFDIFSGGSTRSAIRQAAAEKRELEKKMDEARITAAKEIRSAGNKVEATRRKFELQTENTQLIQATRDLVKKEYDGGQASLVRLNQAQNDLVASQGALADARVSLSLAMEELDYYTGRNIP